MDEDRLDLVGTRVHHVVHPPHTHTHYTLYRHLDLAKGTGEETSVKMFGYEAAPSSFTYRSCPHKDRSRKKVLQSRDPP